MDFNSILIGSEDPKRLVDYYTQGDRRADVLRRRGVRRLADRQRVLTIGPHSEVKGRNPSPGRLIWNIVTTDVQGEFDRMKAAGATVVTEPYEFEQAPGSRIATFEDPDGNYFQLMTPIEM